MVAQGSIEHTARLFTGGCFRGVEEAFQALRLMAKFRSAKRSCSNVNRIWGADRISL